DGVVFRQWIDRILTLALDPQWRPAGRENLDGAAGSEQPGDISGGVEQMLEVVEQEERTPVAELCQLPHAGNACDRRPHELRRGQRRERDEEHPARETLEQLGADLQAESRLATPAGPGQRHESLRVRQ